MISKRGKNSYILVYTLVSVAVAYGLYLGDIPGSRYLLVVYGVVYPHIVIGFLFIVKQRAAKLTPILLQAMDAVNLGVFLALSGMPLIESPLFIMMLLSTVIPDFCRKKVTDRRPGLMLATDESI